MRRGSRILAVAAAAAVVWWGLGWRPVEATDGRLTRIDGRVLRDSIPFNGMLVERAADGRVVASTEYRAGLRDGESLRFDHDGTLLERRTWTAGQRQGTHAGWYPRSGRPRFCYVFDGDVNDGPAYEWADLPGSPIVGRWTYVKGVEVGMQRVWRADGIVRANYLADGHVRYGLRGKKECSR